MFGRDLVEGHLLPRHAAEHQRRIGDAPRQRSGMVERPGQRKHPVERNEAVGRLDADDSTVGGRDADRASGVRPDGERHDPGRNGGGGPAARPSGGAAGVDRVVGLADRGMGDAIGVFEEIGLAEEDRSGIAQPGDKRGVCVGERRCDRPCPVARGRAAHVDQVLDRDGHAVERTQVPPRTEVLAGLVRLRARAVGEDRGKGVEFRLARGDQRQRGLDLVPRR